MRLVLFIFKEKSGDGGFGKKNRKNLVGF